MGERDFVRTEKELERSEEEEELSTNVLKATCGDTTHGNTTIITYLHNDLVAPP